MKKLQLLYLTIILCQFVFSCSPSSTRSYEESQGIDNRIVFYDTDQMLYTIEQNISTQDMFAVGGYPIWLDSKLKIGFHSPSNYEFYIIDAEEGDTLETYDIAGYGTFTFGRYSEVLDLFTFAVNNLGQRSLALMDQEGNIDIIMRENSLVNPVFSGSDDWLYHLRGEVRDWDIYRMKIDGSVDEPIVTTQEFSYGNFSVSFDGKFVVAPKVNDDLKYIAIINTETKEERLIDLTYLIDLGHTSFSKDNKYIFFAAGENYDLHQINFDGTGLLNLTDDFHHYRRPLTW